MSSCSEAIVSPIRWRTMNTWRVMSCKMPAWAWPSEAALGIAATCLPRDHRDRAVSLESVRDVEDQWPAAPEEDLPIESSGIDRAIVVEALAGLRAQEREALYLSVVEGMTAREIAELNGAPRNTVLSWIHRAKQQLRDRLQVLGLDWSASQSSDASSSSSSQQLLEGHR